VAGGKRNPAERLDRGLAGRLADHIDTAWAAAGRPILVGLCGPQGCGKSTLAGKVDRALKTLGRSSVVLSIDDLYLTRQERGRLAADVHPLLAVRGPPGTHDMALAAVVLDALLQGTPVRLPRFDKGRDDRLGDQPLVVGPTDVILFEGWCVGARAEPADALAEPVNALEREEDPESVWRAYVNQALAGSYRALFDRLDLYVLLQAPSFDVVVGWRQEQEHGLRRRSGAGMSDPQVARFVQHYERLSRHIAREAPHRADVVVWLDEARQPIQIESRS